MLRLQPRVPVYTGEVECETTVGFILFCICIIKSEKTEVKIGNRRVGRRSRAPLLGAPS